MRNRYGFIEFLNELQVKKTARHIMDIDCVDYTVYVNGRFVHNIVLLDIKEVDAYGRYRDCPNVKEVHTYFEVEDGKNPIDYIEEIAERISKLVADF